MITIQLVDSGCERYTIKSDCYCLGRKWEHLAEKIQVIKPQVEENNVCTMIVSANGIVIDHLDIKDEPKDITNVLTRNSVVEISFAFTNESGYVKNSEIKSFYFAEGRKPEDFVPVEPEQTGKIDVLLGNGFVRAELNGNIVRFFNANGENVQDLDLSSISVEGGSGGIVEESDPTVPDYVKNISEEDIESWNNKATTDYVDEQVDDVREVAEGKTKSFTVTSLSDLGTLLGIDTSVVSNEYTITNTTITYKEKSIELKQGDLFLIVDTNVPDYWVSVDDMKIYKMETTKVDLTDYVKFTDYATYTKAGLVRPANGLTIVGTNKDGIGITKATNTQIDEKKDSYCPIVSSNLDYAIKVGITTNTIKLTEEEKTKAQSWLGVPTITATQLEDGSYSLTINTEV